MLKNIKKKIRIKICSILTRVVSLDSIVILLRLKLVRNNFTLNGEEIGYVFHSHNNMGLTERTVELGIAKSYLEKSRPKALLEIGNVTNYYYDLFKGTYSSKQTVDLGEEDYNVVKKDIADFKSNEKFDFILSISTFEHMDEEEFRPKTIKLEPWTVAAKNIIYCYENLLEDGGTFLLTAALGWTKEWDLTFKTDLLKGYPFSKMNRYLLHRVSEQEWKQEENIFHEPTPYGSPFQFGNWLSVIEIKK